jgi:hypothetical protein
MYCWQYDEPEIKHLALTTKVELLIIFENGIYIKIFHEELLSFWGKYIQHTKLLGITAHDVQSNTRGQRPS